MNSIQIISAFRSISNFTGDMAEAARAGEWDKLAELEERCAAVVAQLRAAQPTVPLTGEMQRQKVELIHKILADDARIRSYTEPWMRRIQTLLSNTGMTRRVHQAYGRDGFR
ncbi:flagellar protein FliT [Nitrosovibrio tenuis]|uniref:Flagellar protein FliT n=1 Tax=Nitrosovibrio tenuis TaxID=1233 RepID=A0A1H7J4N6_9PROT|nr:flagellar protein FliT [Nitrosovibrio tenuis]SEK69546.1 flagellar protein FliT [Nitrosovibrio tenuis]